MKRFLKWLFPDFYSPWAKCGNCQCQIAKIRAVRDGLDRFCSEKCAQKSWEAHLW